MAKASHPVPCGLATSNFADPYSDATNATANDQVKNVPIQPPEVSGTRPVGIIQSAFRQLITSRTRSPKTATSIPTRPCFESPASSQRKNVHEKIPKA